MERRKFCQYVAMGSACFAGILGPDLVYSQAKSRHKWVVLYWMPYDNDLVAFGEPIMELIIRGTTNSQIPVVVQSDYLGDSQMRRRQIINGTITELEVSEKDSSNISAFVAYLQWALLTFEAEHWAVIVMGHGGKINEISPDDHGGNLTRTWMEIEQFTNALNNFNKSVQGQVELLFFQNCNKATLEVIYQAKNCAKYTLASQLNLGAPNYYYEGFLQKLPFLNNGREAGIAIMNSERIDMFHTLTLVNNKAVKALPKKFSKLLQILLNHDLPIINQSKLPIYKYFNEQQCDVLILLNYLSRTNIDAENEFNKFASFLSSSVIIFYKTGGELYHTYQNTYLENLSGLGLYFPKTKHDIFRYKFLALNQEINLVNLFLKII